MDTRIITVAAVNIKNILTTLSLFDSAITLFNNSLHFLFLIISMVIESSNIENTIFNIMLSLNSDTLVTFNKIAATDNIISTRTAIP